MKTVDIDQIANRYIIRFRFPKGDPQFQSTLTFVKSLPGREWQKNLYYWTVPILEENKKKLEDYGFTFPVDVQVEKSNWQDIRIDESKCPGLRDYQYDAIRFLINVRGRGLISDPMGSGKSCEVLSYAKYSDKKQVLFVVPASIKLQWRAEFRKWLSKELDIEILAGQKTYPLSKGTSYIINWDILSYWSKELVKHPFDLIVGDEIQAIGNSSSKRSKAFKKVCKKIPEVIPLSGTPIRSRPSQFFNILNILNKGLFSNAWSFMQRYCDPKHNGFGWNFDGASNIEELHELVSTVMLRREKEDILKDLPAKTQIVIPLDDVELSDYLAMSKKLQSTFRTGNKKEVQKSFDDLKWSAFESKKNAVVKWIEEFISTGEKLVVFAYHRSVVEYLSEVFEKQCVKIYGGISATQRKNAIEQFTGSDKIKLLFGNILAAGVGIDGLQGVCSNSATVELVWTPSDHMQAEDRLHRLGQKNPVNSYYLIAPGTVEEDIMKILDNKKQVIDGIISGKSIGEIDLLGDLLKEYK